MRSASSPARLDARLVPAALTSWMVTAAGIWWPVGNLVGSLCAVGSVIGALSWWVGQRQWRRSSSSLRSASSRQRQWRRSSSSLRSASSRRGPSRIQTIGVGLVAVGIVGAGFGFAIALRASAVAHHAITAAFGTAAPVTVRPSESALSVGHNRLMFRATLQRLGRDEISGRVVVFAPAHDFSEVMVGQPVQFRARITRPIRHDLTVAKLNATSAPSMGRAGPAHRAAHAVRVAFASTARQVLPADQAAMLPGLVLGDTSAVTSATSREFRAAGLTHLTAVSGANVTIVCGAVLFSSRLVGSRAAVGLAGAVLVVFVIVVEPTASVLRAAVMGAIALAGVLCSRRRQAVPALSATVLVLMVAAPQLAVDVGFALSVVATAALVVIAPAWSRRLVAAGWPKPVSDAVCVACAAQLVTEPLIAGISGRVSLVAAAANLAVEVLIAPITVLGSAAGALCVFWPPGAQLLIRFTGPELWWVLQIAHWAARVPAASVPVPPGLLGVLLVAATAALAVMLWRWRWFRAAMAIATAGLLAWSLSSLLVGGGGSVGRT